jgi:hypothetical protein
MDNLRWCDLNQVKVEIKDRDQLTEKYLSQISNEFFKYISDKFCISIAVFGS